MPRAFLVVKKNSQQQLHHHQEAGIAGSLASTADDMDHLVTDTHSQPESRKRQAAAAVEERSNHSTDYTRYMAPLAGVMEQPRPSSASPAASYISSEEPFSPTTSEHREGSSPHSQMPNPTTGLPFPSLPSAYELPPHKRQRLSPVDEDPKACTISPGSTVSESASSDVVPSPCKPYDPRYLMYARDMSSQVSVNDQHLQPLSPLHHLVRQHPQQLAFPPGAFPSLFGMPFMRAPMFLPQHFPRHYPHMPSMLPETETPRDNIHTDSSNKHVQMHIQQEEKKSEPSKPSPRPRISHNIDDLLARSPPKTKKPAINTSVEQPKPVQVHVPEAIVVEPVAPTHSPRRVVYPSAGGGLDSPMHQLVAMERMYTHSPRNLHPQHPHAAQSPKAGSYPPAPVTVPAQAPASPMKSVHIPPRQSSVPRKLEEDFKKQYLESILPEALRQRQQRLAEEYRELLQMQNARLAMGEHHHQPRSGAHPKDRRGPNSGSFAPSGFAMTNNLNTNTIENSKYIQQEFPREAVFPNRIGEEDGHGLSPSLAERLSPSVLENLPVDFSKACSKRAGPPRFSCDGCKKSYSTLNGLSKHKEFHCVSHVKKEFSCKQCAKTYTSLGALKMHIRTHTLPCKCDLCGKAFSRPWLLQGHIRTHTGEKPFSCQHCHRSFADRSNLRAHLQTHTDVKRYSCDTCSKTFSRMSLLTKHRENGCSSSRQQHI